MWAWFCLGECDLGKIQLKWAVAELLRWASAFKVFHNFDHFRQFSNWEREDFRHHSWKLSVQTPPSLPQSPFYSKFTSLAIWTPTKIASRCKLKEVIKGRKFFLYWLASPYLHILSKPSLVLVQKLKKSFLTFFMNCDHIPAKEGASRAD